MYAFHVNIYIVFSISILCVAVRVSVYGVSLSAFRFLINQQIDNRTSTKTKTTSASTRVTLLYIRNNTNASIKGKI